MSAAAGTSADRARAARVLVDILYEGRTTDQTFGSANASPRLQELVYGTLRYHECLAPLLDKHLDAPLRTKDLDLRCLMLVGAYQLHYMRIPDHAAVFETVNACRGLKKPWARGLVNAVLRKVSRDHPDERSFGLPEWLLEKLKRDFPDLWRSLAAASLARAPMSLRINVRRIDPARYREQLSAAGVVAHAGWHPEHLILESPLPVRDLPGYAEGLVSVQDAGAQLAADLVMRDAPTRILDACAAPGGKLFHLAERAPEATLVGVELASARYEHLRGEAARLGHARVRLELGDATTDTWIAADLPRRYDAIVLDAPCSGSGTLRRHPEIKLQRRPTDLPGFAALQRRLLDNLWRHLDPAGAFLYCTCSLFPEENDHVVGAFLADHPDATIERLALPTGQATEHGWQLLPLPPDSDGPDRTVDGFYFARLTRREKAR